MLVVRELDPPMNDAFRARLADGGSLGPWLATLPLESGAMAALLPSTISAQQMRQLDFGGVASRLECLDWLKALFTSCVVGKSDRMIAFDNPLMRSTDPAVTKWPPETVRFYEQHVLHLVGPGMDANEVGAILQHATPPGWIAALLRFPSGVPPLRSGDLLPSDLDRFRLATEAVLLGAYDGESCLLWSRDKAGLDQLGKLASRSV